MWRASKRPKLQHKTTHVTYWVWVWVWVKVVAVPVEKEGLLKSTLQEMGAPLKIAFQELPKGTVLSKVGAGRPRARGHPSPSRPSCVRKSSVKPRRML